MPLRDVAELHAWADRERPSDGVWRVVATWVLGLGVASWQAPSAPHDELSNVPEYQIRATTPLPGTGGVIVIYRVEGSTDIVDLWWVGRW